jgi:hypothetical protein
LKEGSGVFAAFERFICSRLLGLGQRYRWAPRKITKKRNPDNDPFGKR